MASPHDPGSRPGTEADLSLGEKLRTILVSGAAITIPLLVTIIVLTFVVNFALQAISPLVVIMERTVGVGRDLSELELQALVIAGLVALVFVVGLVAETTSGSGIERAFDATMARIPGVGSVYTSFNEMSELLLSNDTQSFREVKLVEFPSEGMYTVAFVTAETPDAFRSATDNEEMTTLFMPLAPNPVMGGFVLHVARNRVHDVDLSVQEGLRSIVTSGVATGETGEVPPDGELIGLGGIRKQALDGVEDIGDWGARTADDITDLAMAVEIREAGARNAPGTGEVTDAGTDSPDGSGDEAEGSSGS